MTWFKCFAEWASDPKVQTMTEAQQRRLIMLYCLCCTADPTQLTDGEVANAFRISLREWRKTRDLFVRKRFMEEDGSVPNFEARQSPADPTGAERQRRYRRRHASPNGHVTRDVASSRAGEKRAEEKRSDETRPDEGARAPRDVTPNRPTGPDRSDSPAPPEVMEVARRAADAAGPEWGAWAIRMWRHGYEPGWIRDVVAKLRDRGQLRTALAEGILRSYRDQGGPDRPAVQGGPAPVPVPVPVAPGRIEPPPYIPAGPEGDAIRAMYEPASVREEEDRA